MKLIQTLEQIEAGFFEIAIRVTSLLAPVPTAALVVGRTVEHLHWQPWVAWVAGIAIEGLGFASMNMALTLYQYNLTKRQKDPKAPTVAAIIISVIYFVTVIFLTVALDTAPALAIYAPVAFPLISACGAGLLVLRYNHVKRLGDIAETKAKEKAAREQRKQEVQQTDTVVSQPKQVEQVVSRTEQVLAYYKNNPLASQKDAASEIGVSRQYIGQVLQKLESDEVIKRNGHGIEIIK